MHKFITMVGKAAANRDGRRLGLDQEKISKLIGINCWFAKRCLATSAARANANQLLDRVALAGSKRDSGGNRGRRDWNRFNDFTRQAFAGQENLRRGAAAGAAQFR